MLTLRPFQEKLLSQTRNSLRRHRSVLMQLSPGGGKTVIAAFMIQGAVKKNLRAWFVCHRQELIFQTAKTFDKLNLDYGYIAAGYPMDMSKRVQICSIDTLKNRYEKVLPPDMIIVDEAHHISAAGWSRVANYFDKAFRVGLSGTPHRLDGKGLSQYFEIMVLGPTPEWMMQNGYLSRYRFFNPNTPDMSKSSKVAGDYNKRDADEIMSAPSVTGNVISHYKEHANGKRAILFATSIERSKAYAKKFMDEGIMAAHLDGKTPQGTRRAASLASAYGDLQVLCNVNLFGEGYDLSAQAGIDCPVEVVIDCQPTLSLSRCLQMWFRAMRPQGEPSFIFDHSGNCNKHGLPDFDREWSLEGSKDQGKKVERELPIRQCMKCFAVSRNLQKCPECGYVYPVKQREIEEVDGALNEVTDKDRAGIRHRYDQERMRARTLDQLIALGRKKGYKSPEKWAGHVWSARQAKAARYARR